MATSDHAKARKRGVLVRRTIVLALLVSACILPVICVANAVFQRRQTRAVLEAVCQGTMTAEEAVAELGGKKAGASKLVCYVRRTPRSDLLANSAIYLLFKCGKSAERSFMQMFNVRDWNRRHNIATSIDSVLCEGGVGPEGSVVIPALVQVALEDANYNVRLAAFDALAQVPSPDARVIEALVAGLKDGDASCQDGASRGLVTVGAPALPTLVRSLRSKNNTERRLCAWVLGEMGEVAGPAMPQLEELLNDKDESVRETVVDSMVSIKRALYIKQRRKESGCEQNTGPSPTDSDPEKE
jgi:HEAT repeat protein